MNASNNKLVSFLDDLSFTIKNRKHLLTPKEKKQIYNEIDYAYSICDKASNISELIIFISKRFDVFYTEPYQCLLRIHEIATVGTLSSCTTSLPIVQALFSSKLFDKYGSLSETTIIGRGHIAPAFYAIRHTLGGFPLSFIASVHGAVPAVVNKNWGFSNTMRHSLGEGLPMSVGQALLSKDDKTHICFVGDGELDEGVSMEALRIAYVNDVENMIVIVDDNGSGIEQQPKAFNMNYFKSIFVKVVELNLPNADSIMKEIKLASISKKRTAIVCKSTKGPHSYKSPNIDKSKSLTTCSYFSSIVQSLREKYIVHVFTADLASRFGFTKKQEYINVGLSEAASIGMTMALDKHNIKIVMTDDKYLFNSIDILTSAMSHSENLHIIAARKNVLWGGHTCSSTIFSIALDVEIYELVNPLDLEYFIRENIKHNNNALYLINDQPQAQIEKMKGEYKLLNSKVLYKKHKKNDILIITSESMAFPVFNLLSTYNFSHLRFLTHRPTIFEEIKKLITQYKKIIVVEYCEKKAGLSEYLESKLHYNIVSFSVKGYEYPSQYTNQDALLNDVIEYLKTLKE